MQRIYEIIERLIDYAKKNLGLDVRNEDYVRNGIFRLFGLDSFGGQKSETDDKTPERLLAELEKECVAEGLVSEEKGEYICDAVMGELMLSPKEVEDKFYDIARSDGYEAATEWFYGYCVKSDYVKKAKLDLNPRFESDGLIITINKAKPEFRDPKKAVSGNSTRGGYPKCSICHENEGFSGRNKRTLRTVDIELGKEKWFWQFSPYGYFYQHGIAVNHSHTPMCVNGDTFIKLMDFVDLFPHYFIGCNAPLPRIGGSVLAHDHYQGGGEILPMHKAKPLFTLKNPSFPDATAEVVDWPGTVVRIVSESRRDVAALSEIVRAAWVSYNAPELGIISQDENGIHNAISPTVVKTGRGYEMSIILRSNITDDKYPDGVFHAHPQYHMIKKESIGLIEAQGLFILPGRLEKELCELEEVISESRELPAELTQFKLVYDEVRQIGGDVREAMKKELASICNRILENTAVFKDKGQIVKFLNGLGFAS